MKQRIRLGRGESSATFLADVDGVTVTFPASALPYTPHHGMGLTVDGRPVSTVELTKDYSPPGPAMVKLTLAAN